MEKLTRFACFIFMVVLAANALAADLPQRVIGHESVLHGGNAAFAKSVSDTLFMIGPWGSGAQINGQFETPSGGPAWNGWTHRDATQPTITHWHVSDYAASNLPGGAGNLAAYCGDEAYSSCDAMDPVGGYGNNWNDILEFSYEVANADEPCTIEVSGVFNSNTEPGYDYVTFKFMTADAPVVVASYDGIHQGADLFCTHTYDAADYVGFNNNEVRFQIIVTSDGGWSDSDCLYWGDGACQFDDLRVQCDNGNYDMTTDFQDGTFGQWNVAFPVGCGDFTQLWGGLEDIDPCFTNNSFQVAFIDDGTQVPGVGPSYCQNWCYGPGGYIVNTTGGARPNWSLVNDVDSPVFTLPGGDYTGFEFEFGVYRHEDLTADSPSIFYTWNVRSGANEASLLAESWENRNYVYYGYPAYIRAGSVVSDLMLPGSTVGQVQLKLIQIHHWGWYGHDGYPAPYFDNVRFTAYQIHGPAMSTREIDLAQDNFSSIGEGVVMDDLAINNVRFDATLNKAIGSEEHNIPGDSITCDVVSVRAGADLVSNRLVYTMQRNSVFDSVRDPAWDVSGSTPAQGDGLTGEYYYDLPDSGFLFPGDILHYYFEATDEVAHTDPQTTTLPADISGFGDFSHPLAYNTLFQVHALPSVNSEGDHPGILFWNDFASRGGENEWFTAMNNIGLQMGVDYDVYRTNGPSSGVGNGLGGRAVYEQIKDYTELLYTCGDLGVNTISNGDFNNDPSRDIQLLVDWFNFGSGRDAFFCGDELANDLSQADALTSGFLNDIMNLQLSSNNIRPLIAGQTTPVVLPEANNSVFYTTTGWIAYGACIGINTFDAVSAGAGAERLARFTNPSGAPDYSYSAATLNYSGNDRIITMPYDFMCLYTDPGNPVPGGRSARANVLREILSFFQVSVVLPPVNVPDADQFYARNYPNPFNPSTKIEFNLPLKGHLSLKVFNVRGELVKTLIDDNRPAGPGHVMWDGTNSLGASVSSGVYFYEARTGGEVQVHKMALVK